MELTTFIEEYAIGRERVAYGRTIPETDFAVRAGAV